MKMRGFSGLFFVVCLFGAVIAFPTSDLDDDAEIIVVPLEAQQEQTNFGGQTNKNVNNFDGTVTTDFHPGFPSFTPVNAYNWNFGFFDRFYDIVRQLRERVQNVWAEASIDSPNADSTPSVKTNSTSRVEYIDGRKVVINDTFYTKETDFGTSVYNVRVIDFLPQDDDEITSTTNDGKPELDTENIDDKTEIKPSTDGELDRGSPEELESNDNDNEIIQDIDDVEVKPSSDVPSSPVV